MDVGVPVLQGCVKCFFFPVGVHRDIDGVFDVCPEQPLEELHDYRGLGYRSIVIQAVEH